MYMKVKRTRWVKKSAKKSKGWKKTGKTRVYAKPEKKYSPSIVKFYSGGICVPAQYRTTIVTQMDIFFPLVATNANPVDTTFRYFNLGLSQVEHPFLPTGGGLITPRQLQSVAAGAMPGFLGGTTSIGNATLSNSYLTALLSNTDNTFSYQKYLVTNCRLQLQYNPGSTDITHLMAAPVWKRNYASAESLIEAKHAKSKMFSLNNGSLSKDKTLNLSASPLGLHGNVKSIQDALDDENYGGALGVAPPYNMQWQVALQIVDGQPQSAGTQYNVLRVKLSHDVVFFNSNFGGN